MDLPDFDQASQRYFDCKKLKEMRQVGDAVKFSSHLFSLQKVCSQIIILI